MTSPLTIKRDIGPAPAPTQADAVAEAVRKAREATMAKAAAEHNQFDSVIEEEGTPREDIDSIDVDLPCGTVVFGPPPGVSLTMRIATFPEAVSSAGLLRVLMCIRSIDGKPIRPLTNMVDAQKLANTIGDRYIDLLAGILAEYWPPIRKQDLPTIKKNLR